MAVSIQEAADLFRSPPQRFIDVGQGEVAYRTVGSGPDVIFVHGWPASGATFRKLLPHLASHVRCHLLDLPGAGDSRFTESTELSIENHIRAVRSVVDQLELDDFAVVGRRLGVEGAVYQVRRRPVPLVPHRRRLVALAHHAADACLNHQAGDPLLAETRQPPRRS